MSAAIKDKERLERLSTVRAAEKGMKEELQEKIQIKQEEAAKRQGSKVFTSVKCRVVPIQACRILGADPAESLGTQLTEVHKRPGGASD